MDVHCPGLRRYRFLRWSTDSPQRCQIPPLVPTHPTTHHPPTHHLKFKTKTITSIRRSRDNSADSRLQPTLLAMVYILVYRYTIPTICRVRNRFRRLDFEHVSSVVAPTTEVPNSDATRKNVDENIALPSISIFSWYGYVHKKSKKSETNFLFHWYITRIPERQSMFMFCFNFYARKHHVVLFTLPSTTSARDS